MGPGDISTLPICISDQVLSVNYLPPDNHVDLVLPNRSARMSPDSSPEAPIVPSADSNRIVYIDSYILTPDVLDAGPVFEVSPDTTGFMLRTRDNAVPTSPVGLPIQLGSESDLPPQLGELVVLNLSRSVPGSDALAMTFPIYPLPPGMALMPVSQSAQTILASGVSSQQDRWSSAESRTRYVSREGPFDAYCVPMDTGECPLVATGLLGCPYRITSYTGPAVADTDLVFGIQLHHPRFLEFIRAPESARLLFRSQNFWIQKHGSGGCGGGCR